MPLTLINTERIEEVEVEVLADVVRDMDGWIDRLPAESSWRWAFVQCRRDIANGLESRAENGEAS